VEPAKLPADGTPDRAWWVGFRLAEIASTSRLRALVERFESLEAAWHARPEDLRRVLGTRERSLSTMLETRARLDPVAELDRLERAGVSVVTIADDAYPRLLKEVAAPPPVLFCRGQLLETDDAAVAIVGTRRATAYGQQMATDLAGGLAAAGVTVVSGLALGIDSHAHRAAIAGGGRTIAVLGSGIFEIYPREHRNLAGQVAGQGALISDNPPHAKPDRWNFPARNRIISGLSLAVIVVEAPEKSGALITVDFAADQGRDVFAVPGPANAIASAGCNRILRDGARLVRSVDDVLEDLRLPSRGQTEAVQQALPLDEDERLVLSLLTGAAQHIDDVVDASGRPLPRVSAVLLSLELQELVRNVGAQYYTRR